VLVEVLTGRFTDLVHGGTFVVTMGLEGVSGRHHQGTVWHKFSSWAPQFRRF
jgi:hypothetical protein